ncbi:MAG: peptidoglycan-associated lipoprotein [Micavibrio sp.]|nr:peptidoglycan-associated lipoprotein [Micavibrio sp.]|tara:strand:- start:786 stop:1319 length:534 start_codon:yes stop_codon:yes gene_type:complete
MITKKILTISAILLLAACSSNKDKDVPLSEVTEIGTTGQAGQPIGQGTMFDDVELSGPQAGTQEDLVVNVGDRVYFGYDRYDLTSEARAQLDLQAQWLNKYPSTAITVEGHADERGTREYNLALGERRATSVKNYLVALGVTPSRIQTISYGKERPVAVGSNEQSWAQNRRAVTVVN